MHTSFKDLYVSAHISGVTQYKFIGMKNVSNECSREKIITLLGPIHFIQKSLLNVPDKCSTPCNFIILSASQAFKGQYSIQYK
jgi:hypothetical protein